MVAQQQKTNLGWLLNFFVVYLIMLVIAVLCLVISGFQLNKGAEGEYIDYSQEWLAEDDSEFDLDRIFDDVTVIKKLPEKINCMDTLFFQAKNILVSVYIDGTLVEDYGAKQMEKSFHYKAPGTYFVMVPLSEADAGKEIAIKILSPYKNDNSCNIKEVKLGNCEKIMKEAVISRLVNFVVCLAIAVMGVLFLCVALPLRKYDRSGNALTCLGLFSLVLGVWAMSETKLLQLLTGYSNFMHLVTGLTLLLIVIPLFLFFKGKHTVATVVPTLIVSVVASTIFVVSLILHFCDIRDLHENIGLAHFSIIFAIIFTLYYAIRGFMHTKIRDASAIGLFLIGLCSLADIILYYAQINNNSSLFTKLGVMGYVIILAFDIFKEYIKMYNLGIKSEMLNKMAYTDILTEFYNRNSFEEDMEILDSTENLNDNKVIAVFDVNNLKYINDTYGHSFGDAAIVESAELIKNVFDKYGKCYRIGGDEFCFISEDSNVTKEKIEKLYASFEATLNIRNKEPGSSRPFPLIIAFGCSVVQGDVKTLDAAFQIADGIMYENKQELKKKYAYMNLR